MQILNSNDRDSSRGIGGISEMNDESIAVSRRISRGDSNGIGYAADFAIGKRGITTGDREACKDHQRTPSSVDTCNSVASGSRLFKSRLQQGVIDLEVDVHHRNSSGCSLAAYGSASSGSLMPSATKNQSNLDKRRDSEVDMYDGNVGCSSLASRRAISSKNRDENKRKDIGNGEPSGVASVDGKPPSHHVSMEVIGSDSCGDRLKVSKLENPMSERGTRCMQRRHSIHFISPLGGKSGSDEIDSQETTKRRNSQHSITSSTYSCDDDWMSKSDMVKKNSDESSSMAVDNISNKWESSSSGSESAIAGLFDTKHSVHLPQQKIDLNVILSSLDDNITDFFSDIDQILNISPSGRALRHYHQKSSGKNSSNLPVTSSSLNSSNGECWPYPPLPYQTSAQTSMVVSNASTGVPSVGTSLTATTPATGVASSASNTLHWPEMPNFSTACSASNDQQSHSAAGNGVSSHLSSLRPMRFAENSLYQSPSAHMSPSPARFSQRKYPHSTTQRQRPKQYYVLTLPRINFWSKKSTTDGVDSDENQRRTIRLRFDRLHLMTLLDRCSTPLELFASIFLALATAFFGSACIESGFFTDLPLFLFCLVLASSQYTLLKSVQPDAASPTHGFNRIIVYSRPIYFSLICGILLAANTFFIHRPALFSFNFSLYSINLLDTAVISGIFSAAKIFLLSFPAIFAIGLLPQIDTFVIYLVEQIDVHLFGGAALTTGLASVAWSVFRTCYSVGILCLIGYFSLPKNASNSFKGGFGGSRDEHDVRFSVFCACLVSISWFMSRLSSDPMVFSGIFKRTNSKKCSQKSGDMKKASVAQKLKKLRVKKKFKNEKLVVSGMRDGGISMNEIDVGNPLVDGGDDETCVKRRDDIDGNGTLNSKSSKVRDDSGSLNVKREMPKEDSEDDELNFTDPLPERLRATIISRLENDGIVCLMMGVLVFAVHVSAIFTLQPYVDTSLRILALVLGFTAHYLMNHAREELPWAFLASPLLRSYEHLMYEAKGEAKLMWFERLQAWLVWIEKNIVYPLFFLSSITMDAPLLIGRFGPAVGTLITVVVAMKCLRSTFADSSHNYLILLFTFLMSKYDFAVFLTEPQLLNFSLTAVIYHKINELRYKWHFILTYIAPWQISWGSAFHAFAQPFAVPHSGLLSLQAIISSLLSAPFAPVLGSALFLTSYVRPTKFWERDYRGKRPDPSENRLVHQLERNLGTDDNNLNAIFYEHLTRSLQTSLAGDLVLGRWGQVSSGDFFVLASDNLNCLIHIVELANGLVTFQVRGLEFRGTYCQQREVEAINEGVGEDEACCCCRPGRIPGLLSVNAAFNQRWLAWSVARKSYILEGYSITDNSASIMLQNYDLRKILITHYIQSIIFFCVSSSKLTTWLEDEVISEVIRNITGNEHTEDASSPRNEATTKRPSCSNNVDLGFVDLDPIFSARLDDDYDSRAKGVTRRAFEAFYEGWIEFCLKKRQDSGSTIALEKVVSLCFALSLLGRRALAAAAHHNYLESVEFMLFGLHALFKGDFRLTSVRDEWVFRDMDLLKKVVAPAVRMAVKLHQDHFMADDEYSDYLVLWFTIQLYKKEWVISHEGDPVWRNALLSNVPSLLALRSVFDENTNQYKFIQLNRRHLIFRVIKINRECVRGLWAGQQQELVYLRNRNTERGSIQNAKQALRNIINSSCDQPIGYPIYVSPLTTSFVETHHQLSRVFGHPLSFGMFKRTIVGAWQRLKRRCGQGLGNGSIDTGGVDVQMRELGNQLSQCRVDCGDFYDVISDRGRQCPGRSHRSDRGLNEYESHQLLNRKQKNVTVNLAQMYTANLLHNRLSLLEAGSSQPLTTSTTSATDSAAAPVRRSSQQSASLSNYAAFRPSTLDSNSHEYYEMNCLNTSGRSTATGGPSGIPGDSSSLTLNVTLRSTGSGATGGSDRRRSRPELV